MNNRKLSLKHFDFAHKKTVISFVQVENMLSIEDSMKSIKKIEDQGSSMSLWVQLAAESGEVLDLIVNDIDFLLTFGNIINFSIWGKKKSTEQHLFLKLITCTSYPIPPCNQNDY